MLAACSSDGDTSDNPATLAERDLALVFDLDHASLWDRLHPNGQALTTRAAYIECNLADTGSAPDIEIAAGGVRAIGDFTEVAIEVTLETAFGDDSTTVIAYYLPDDAGDLRTGVLPRAEDGEGRVEGIWPS